MRPGSRAGGVAPRGRRRPSRTGAFPVLNGLAFCLIALFSVLPLLYVAYLSLVDVKAGQLPDRSWASRTTRSSWRIG